MLAGITLSKSQVKRGTELAAEQGLGNCSFQVMDALHMDFPDDSFDLVWACESGEHMPDKKLYVEEMTRVLKPGNQRASVQLTLPCLSASLPESVTYTTCYRGVGASGFAFYKAMTYCGVLQVGH